MRQSESRVVITGLGMVTPLGLQASEAWDRSLRGESAIGPLHRFDVSGHECTSAGEVAEFDLTESLRFPKNQKFMHKSTLLAMRAAKEAVEASRINLDGLDPYRVGIYTGSGDTGLESFEFFRALSVVWDGKSDLDYKDLGGRASRLIDPYFSLRTLSNAGIAFLSTEFGVRGPNSNFVQGDTSSAFALSAAFHDLIGGRCDAAIAGGYDSLLNASTYLAYEATGLLSSSAPDEAYRPFDAARNGLVLGEGAAFVVLEPLERAEKRGAPLLAEIMRFASCADPSDSAEPKGLDRSASAAIEETVQGNSVDFIVAHGIGTPSGDQHEAAILRSLFGADIHVTALKSQTGYLGAATGAVEVALTALSLQNRVIPPIARHRNSDLDLHFVASQRQPVASKQPRALSLSWSWGGQFSAFLLGAL